MLWSNGANGTDATDTAHANGTSHLNHSGAASSSTAAAAAVQANASDVSTLESSLETVAPAIPAWILIAAQVPLFIGLAWVRRLSYFAVSNLVADFLIIAGLIVIFGTACYHIIAFPMPPIRLFSSRFPLFLGTAAFAFEGIGCGEAASRNLLCLSPDPLLTALLTISLADAMTRHAFDLPYMQARAPNLLVDAPAPPASTADASSGHPCRRRRALLPLRLHCLLCLWQGRAHHRHQ